MDIRQSNLILNVAPVVTGGQHVKALRHPYVNDEHLRTLRLLHQGEYVFARRREEIEAVPVTPKVSLVDGWIEGEVNLDRDMKTLARLVRESLIHYFHGRRRVLTDFDPVSFLASAKGDDVLADAVPGWKTRPSWLRIVPRYVLDARPFFPDKRKPFVGVAVDVRAAIEIDTDVAALINEGIDVKGLYVSRAGDTADTRIRPRRQLLGRVKLITGSTLTLDDAREGFEVVDSAEVYVEPRRETLRSIASHYLGSNSPLLARIEQATRRLSGGPERLRRIRSLLDHLRSQRLLLTGEVTFTLGNMLGEDGSELPVARAPRPIFIFDAMGRKTDTWNDRGLKKYGPYTSQSFSPTVPKIAIICQRRLQGVVDQVIYKLLHGVKSEKGDSAPFEQGFIRKYGLQDATVQFFLAEDDSVGAYDRAVRDALRVAGTAGTRWDLVLIQIKESFHQLRGSENPYFVSKATLLGEQTPAQSFEIETVETNDNQLGYVLNNIALAAYAKLNGVPWLLQANPTISHEIIFGLGSAELAASRLGAKQRMVGVTTVFTGDGRYHLSNLSQAVPFDEYPEAIVSSLRNTISTVRTDFNWRKGDRIRLVFHAFKEIRHAEADAVKEVMSELTDYEVEYAFLHVAPHHPFVLFDKDQSGVAARDGKKGILAPERGLLLPLGTMQTLIVLTGPRDLKLAEQGLPQPVLLSLHRASTFDDMTYLAKQVVAFAAHSWRSFTPAATPVTILYSDLLAGLLPHLTSVNPSITTALLGRIGSSRWFL